MAERVHLAANNPDLGGGEQMVIRTAEALLALGRPVTVVAPDFPREVLDAATAVGADTVAIRADGRRDYLTRLRTWDSRERTGLLWCHGLVPALATAGHGNRIVHLHQLPRSRAQRAALVLARRGAERVLAPSQSMAHDLSEAQALHNWTAELDRVTRPPAGPSPRIGYLGRLSTDKGIDVLADAIDLVRAAGRPARLLVAGDDRWVDDGQRAVAAAALDRLGDAATRLGHVPPAELFSNVDVVVFPSRWAEPFGLVVAEAMASGVPFVVSDAGALPEVAGPAHPWVARSGDAADLARVVIEALAAPTATRRAVTDAARARWEAEFSPAAGRQRVAQLLDELEVP